MARNTSKTYATMDEDERNRLSGADGAQDEGGALAFDDPRNPDRMGKHYPSLKAEVEDPEHRDGAAAELDDAAHERGVERHRKSK